MAKRKTEHDAIFGEMAQRVIAVANSAKGPPDGYLTEYFDLGIVGAIISPKANLAVLALISGALEVLYSKLHEANRSRYFIPTIDPTGADKRWICLCDPATGELIRSLLKLHCEAESAAVKE